VLYVATIVVKQLYMRTTLTLRKSRFASIGHARSWSSVIKELDKCELLCANCHAERHHNAPLHERVALFSQAPRKPERVQIDWPTRFVLGKLVASKPVSEIARKLGVSDNAVRKRCKALNIPLPHRRGFWAKLRAGKISPTVSSWSLGSP